MRTTILLLAVGLLSPDSLAQSGASGSETSVSSARNLLGSGGHATSANYSAETALAFATAGPAASSASYSFEGGAVLTGPEFAPPGPVVFGLADATGSKDGGESALLFGVGFQAPGAGATSASFAGALGSGATPLSDTQLSVLTPPGTNLFGNPLGRVDVAVANLLGASSAPGAYVYTPALLVEAPPTSGQTFELHLAAQPGDFVDAYLGLSIPGVALPIAGFDGGFELLALFLSPVSSQFATSELTTFALPVPTTPTLVGKTIEWQGFALSSLAPITGSFTNRLATTIAGPPAAP